MSEKRDITIDNKFGRQVVKVEVRRRRKPIYKPIHAQETKESSESELQKRQDAVRRAEVVSKPEESSVTQDVESQRKRAAFFGDRKLLRTINTQTVERRPSEFRRPAFRTDNPHSGGAHSGGTHSSGTHSSGTQYDSTNRDSTNRDPTNRFTDRPRTDFRGRESSGTYVRPEGFRPRPFRSDFSGSPHGNNPQFSGTHSGSGSQFGGNPQFRERPFKTESFSPHSGERGPNTGPQERRNTPYGERTSSYPQRSSTYVPRSASGSSYSTDRGPQSGQFRPPFRPGGGGESRSGFGGAPRTPYSGFTPQGTRPPFKPRTGSMPTQDFKSSQYTPLRPSSQIRKFSKPLPKTSFGSMKSRPKLSNYAQPAQLGHKFLGKIESPDDVTIDERLRSIASVRRFREKQRRSSNGALIAQVVREVIVFDDMPVLTIAHAMAVSVDLVIDKIRDFGMSVNKNDKLDADTACILVEEFGHKYKKRIKILDTIVKEAGEKVDYISRAPIVTVVGHVDHGKTSLLDALRATQFTASESGGITQSIGASQVFIPDGRFITFIDTPGHQIFTEMRARGVNLTDIVLLIIAADDGIKEQTIESIQHAQASKATIIVVITKIDKSDVNLNKIKQMLMTYSIVVESLGGDVPDIEVSAKTGHNLKELIELIILQAELLELNANPLPKASGVVLEAYLDKTRGPVATVIIKNGTLKKTNAFLSGSAHGRVRSMMDWKGAQLSEAGPSFPVQIMGFDKAPSAGDDFIVMDESDAKEAAVKRQELSTASGFTISKSEMTYNVEDIWKALTGNTGVVTMNFIVKADASGSAEAIVGALEKINTPGIQITTILKGIGGVTETDVLLAKASDAIIIAFKVDIKPGILKNAETWGIKIKRYDIIYQILDDIAETIHKTLAPKEEEVSTGRANIKEIFVKHKIGTIAGCFVQDGIIKRDAKAVLWRNGIQVYTSTIHSVRQLRDDKREVKAGQECGIMMAKFADYRAGDVIECFETRPV